MKLMTFKIRGLGSRAKRRELKGFLSEEAIDFACIQETKMKEIDRQVCPSLWYFGNSDNEIWWIIVLKKQRCF